MMSDRSLEISFGLCDKVDTMIAAELEKQFASYRDGKISADELLHVFGCVSVFLAKYLRDLVGFLAESSPKVANAVTEEIVRIAMESTGKRETGDATVFRFGGGDASIH